MQFAFLALATVVLAQSGRYDPRTAAILSEQRYLTGDGTFGAQYKQEDGVEFKEESDAAGNRKGSYSYVDPNGQRHTVSYTAGKDGFKATGDAIPQAPAQAAPQPQYQPLPQYNPPANTYNEYHQQPQQQYQPQYTQPQYQQPQAYQPKPQAYQPQYQSQPQYQPQSQYQPQPQPQYRPQPQYNPSTTPAPHRFYPPGKLSLQRNPDGYAYSFNKS